MSPAIFPTAPTSSPESTRRQDPLFGDGPPQGDIRHRDGTEAARPQVGGGGAALPLLTGGAGGFISLLGDLLLTPIGCRSKFE